MICLRRSARFVWTSGRRELHEHVPRLALEHGVRAKGSSYDLTNEASCGLSGVH
jgi:hypothetical protein